MAKVHRIQVLDLLTISFNEYAFTCKTGLCC